MRCWSCFCIAKRLIDRFGSLTGVFNASHEMLSDAGLTRSQITFIRLIPDVTRLYMLGRYDLGKRDRVLDLDMIGFYIADKFIGKEHEENVLLLLYDGKGKEIFSGFLSSGSARMIDFSVRSVVKTALKYNASSAVIAHNHPSGSATPSADDIRTTGLLKEALSLVGVDLLDHYIVADGDSCSMYLTGLMDRDTE